MNKKKGRAKWKARAKNHQDRIYEFIARHDPEPVTVSQVKAHFGAMIPNPNPSFTLLIRQNRLERVDDGTYKITDKEKKAAKKEPQITELAVEAAVKASPVAEEVAETPAKAPAPASKLPVYVYQSTVVEDVPEWLVKGWQSLHAAMEHGGLPEQLAQAALWNLVKKNTGFGSA
jgi:hypothetical protein